MLIHRSTPTALIGSSPAQLACNRALRTNLPCLPSTLDIKLVLKETVLTNDLKSKSANKMYYDCRHGAAQPLSDLRPGDTVLQKLDGEKSWSNLATVLRQCAPRSYEVQASNGAVYRRNRQHFKQTSRPITDLPPPHSLPLPTFPPRPLPYPTAQSDMKPCCSEFSLVSQAQNFGKRNLNMLALKTLNI